MTRLEELGIVVGIFAGIYTLARGFGNNSCNASAVPASSPSSTVQTTPFAGQAPSIPVPALTNPFTSAPSFPTFQPVNATCGGASSGVDLGTGHKMTTDELNQLMKTNPALYTYLVHPT
jgi:hypothetical protein